MDEGFWKRRLRKTNGMGMTPSVASIQLGFLPLNHILGRNAILMCMRGGGYITFVRLATAVCRANHIERLLLGSIAGCVVCGLAVGTAGTLRCVFRCS